MPRVVSTILLYVSVTSREPDDILHNRNNRARGSPSPIKYASFVLANYCIYPSRLSLFLSPFSPSSVFNHQRRRPILSFRLRRTSLPAAPETRGPRAASLSIPSSHPPKKDRKRKESLLHILFNFALRASFRRQSKERKKKK